MYAHRVGFVVCLWGLYNHEKSSIIPTIIAILCALGFGILFTYSFVIQEIIPILPYVPSQILPFKDKIDLKGLFISMSSPLVVVLIGIHLVKFGLRKNKQVKHEHAQGSARFATAREIKSLHHESGIPIGCLIKGKFSTDIDMLKNEIKSKASQEIIRLNPHHMVLVAPSGAGKGVGIIIPTLLDYEGSVLVTDVKAAENFHVTSRYRKSLGREVYALDPFNKTEQESASINILDYLDPNSEDVVDEAAQIASLLVTIPLHISGNSKHFYDRARAIIQGMILYVVCSSDFSKDEKNLFRVYQLFCQSGEDFKEMMLYISLQENLAFGQPSRIASSLLTTAYEELSGSLNTVRNELSIFDSPLIQKITSKSTIDLVKIVENNADLFLCIPIEKLKTYNRLMRLIVSMIFSIAIKNEH